jgi:hypothetical protein
MVPSGAAETGQEGGEGEGSKQCEGDPACAHGVSLAGEYVATGVL